MNNVIKYQKTIIRLSLLAITLYFLYTLGMIIVENSIEKTSSPIPDLTIISKYFGL